MTRGAFGRGDGGGSHTSALIVLVVIFVVTIGAVIVLPRATAAVVVSTGLLLALADGLRLARSPSVSRDPEADRLSTLAHGAGMVDGAEREVLAALVTPLREGVLLLDGNLTVVAANRRAADIVDQPLDGMLGVSLIRATREVGLVEVARAGTGGFEQVGLANGREVHAAAARVALPGAELMLVLDDVSALRRAERARADLVGNLSHELRTPLASARALAETVRDGVDDPAERQRFLDRLVVDIERLSQMVQGMLRLARLDAGVEEFEPQELEPRRLIDTARDRIGPIAERQEITIATGEVTAARALGDQRRVLEVLSNLVDNALRHSPRGGTVTLTASRDGNEVRFEVRDQGPGILPSDRSRIFERFYTGDSARGGAEGTGLGLAIARQLVTRQGGRIWVADGGSGATLCFALPAARHDDGGSQP